jgi:hypothetical protein
MNLKSEAKKQMQLSSLVSKNHHQVKLSNLVYETLAGFKHQVNNLTTALSPKQARNPSFFKSIEVSRNINKTLNTYVTQSVNFNSIVKKSKRPTIDTRQELSPLNI